MSDDREIVSKSTAREPSVRLPLSDTAPNTAGCSTEADTSRTAFRFVVSPIYETLLSMEALLIDWYDEPWAEEARERMGVTFLRELRNTLEPFRMGVDLFELAVPDSSEQEVDAFVRRVREMSFAEFSYYVFGQLIPMKDGQLSIDPEGIRDLIENYGVYAHYLEGMTRLDWQATGPVYQRRYADLIEEFWTHCFKTHYPTLDVQRSLSIAKNESYGRRNGVEALYQLLTGHEKIHRLMWSDEELRQVSFVPVVNIARPFLVYTGHRDVTVVYHASRTPDRVAELTEREDRLVAVSRALGDKTRFQITKLLFQYHEALNGQNIAEKVHVSKSVVSKHLRQLKEAGIVTETSPDKRNNIYSVNLKTLQEISPGLLEILRG